ncbi:MAG: undecaprenyldiphospho-muramoylpentapeptide beta-N-acetylglucosaminyltransferase [Clostridia bacterium]|nr:undecaprenyldiphospho-muramoylpentapeptide beta-N-acetylglucosaminyltransferase [Clostridia bacterium]
MRVLMTGGGTAGHINPALAIANTIKKNIPDAEIEFVGTKKGLENTLVTKEGYKLHHVNIMGVSRSLSPSNIKAAMLMITSQFEAKKIIKKFKPDIVIGTGGYVCWPALKVAAKMGIPTIAHESNARPGLAIKQLQGNLDKILVNFKDTAKYVKNQSKVVHVGNPLRGGFGGIDYNEAREKLGIKSDETYVLAFGGSLGALRINEIMLEYMNNTAKHNSKVICHLATGRYYYEDFSKRYADAGLSEYSNLSMMEYIHDMHVRMSAADIIVCRAGAMTISELAMMKKACVIIPSPNVVDNHQYKNAKVLADANAALMLIESELDEKSFKNALTTLIDNPKRREELSQNIVEFANMEANDLIFDEVLKLTKK